MARIAVIGGTGYAGSSIVAEGVSRGHTMVSVARRPARDRVHGATYVEGTLLDVPGLVAELEGADAIIVAAAPRGDMAEVYSSTVLTLADALTGTRTRLGVLGGAGGSLAAPGGPRLIDDGFPEEYKPEAQAAIDVLEGLQQSPHSLDWFFIHPAETFGAFKPGERRGAYRDGGDVVVRDEDGHSYISAPDLAKAFIDEIEEPRHLRERFTVGY